MQVRVLYFGAASRNANHEELIKCDSGTSVRDFLDTLVRSHAAISALDGNMLQMVNGAHARPDALLEDGDEMAIVPKPINRPVSFLEGNIT